jgi:PIN domain nuclease of toxin-antitoxin system
VKLLLDTHVYLWWLEDPALLADPARVAVANPLNTVFVSAASIVEIGIKQGIGKLKLDAYPEDQLEACRFHELPFSIAHAAALRSLPPIHKDPFDRMLVAQARAENLTLVTRDPLIERYDVSRLAA